MGACSLAWSVDLSLSLRERAARSDIPGKQTQLRLAHTATKSSFSSALSTFSPLIGPNFLPEHVPGRNSTRVGRRSEVESHQPDLLRRRGAEKSRAAADLLFIKMASWEHD